MIKMKSKDFDKIYKKVPQEQKEMLEEFRASHPYKELDINGTRWRYISCGQGSKTLLFLPGGFTKADMWFYSILALEKDYRIITPDDHVFQGTFEMSDVCDAIVRILEDEDVEKATIIGISAGGGFAQYFIQKYPQKVEHLVISHCGIIIGEHAPELQKRLKMIKLLPFPIFMPIARKLIKKTWVFPISSKWLAFRQAYLREMSLNINKDMFIHFIEGGIKTLRNFVFKPEVLQSWPGEILILGSKGEKWGMVSVEELKARYPKAKTHIFEQGGHHTIFLFPEEYTSVIRDFLKEN